MPEQLWSWILTIVGVTGFVLAGKKIWWCWYINIACQVLWFAYAIISEQYGFIVASVIYTVVFWRNAVVWTREHNNEKSMLSVEEAFEEEAKCGATLGTLHCELPLGHTHAHATGESWWF